MSGSISPPDLSVSNFPAVLRARTVTLLQTIKTIAGNAVESTRVLPVDEADTPRIIVYLDDRDYNWVGDNAPQYDALGKLLVVGFISGAPKNAVEAQADVLSEQILSLMNYEGFLAAPLERVTAISSKIKITAEGERYVAYVAVEFSCKWFEIFEPVLAPLDGATPPPAAFGAPFVESVLTIETPQGEVLSGATIAMPNLIPVP